MPCRTPGSGLNTVAKFGAVSKWDQLIGESETRRQSRNVGYAGGEILLVLVLVLVLVPSR
ncbi:uncharacterized protein BO66DRAFT_78122 [Aspergillus aculeatinus CBS 121060]|uniref:Uncharacterized protein n=1 Tax=Aspergillus aculeatinus CBS 121060 TaxID=1448322 RepID=A0ACD1HB23_9EURO|nr:hypothetical protein BO66DRAFT_78122 [Aspergillus aculeatinus CBS 121060]RAH70679.1 hypothetical protein BO66DRAFT_78122 [Aspergillus aculeatinus CBS 121060]